MQEPKPAEMIHSLRETGMTQKTIATRLQVNQTTVSRYAALEIEPSYSTGKTLEKIYRANVNPLE